jgi:hypothetical protein
MSPDRPTFDGRLRRALRAEAAGFRPLTDASRIERAVASGNRGRMPVALLALPAIALAVAIAIRATAPSAPEGAARRPLPTASASASLRPGSAPIGLADCQIAPADSWLAFAGWTTLDVLHVGGGKAAHDQPIYAVVTRGLAEWVGWKSSGGAMYPRPVGRMGCIYDPSTGESSLVGVPLDWQPPAIAIRLVPRADP